MIGKPEHDAEQRREKDRHEKEKPIPGDAFFVAQRAKSLNAASSEIIDELGIGRGRSVKMIGDAAKQRGQIIFADAEFVVMLGSGRWFAARFQTVLVHFLEDRFLQRG